MKQSILVVDDEIHMVTLLERILSEKTPYTFASTHNALEVPNLLETQKFDLLITDLRMPGLTGMDLLRQVRDNERTEEVIIITAFGGYESALEAFSLGAFDYITKPFRQERLLESVEAAMECQRQRQQAADLEALLASHPYDRAAKAFKRAYLLNLAEGTDADHAKLARTSGLSPEEIAEILTDET